MTRAVWWGLIAAVVVLVVYNAPTEQPSIVQPAARAQEVALPQRPAADGRGAAAQRPEPPRHSRTQGLDAVAELFPPAEWLVPEPMPAPPQAPPAPVLTVQAPPQAPPLPFKVLGSARDAGNASVFLQFNDQNLVARQGDLLLDQYRVEQLDEVSMTLTHVPTGQRQTLALAGAR